MYKAIVKGWGYDAFCKAYKDGKIKNGEMASVYYLGIFLKDRLSIFPEKDGSPGLTDTLWPAEARDFIGNRRWKVKAKT